MSGAMAGGAVWPWFALALLGALHGVNPGMGWLFAVALGMQQGERRAIWRALVPLALGHAMAIVVAVSLAGALGLVVPPAALRWIVVALLVTLGVRQLQHHRHPSAGGMRVGGRQLATWSFLVATAHGAGLMAVPLADRAGALGAQQEAYAAAAMRGGRTAPVVHASVAHHDATTHRASVSDVSRGTIAATLVHTMGYLLVTALLAVVVYERAGLRFLRRAWLNVDRLWALSLLVTAVAVAWVGS